MRQPTRSVTADRPMAPATSAADWVQPCSTSSSGALRAGSVPGGACTKARRQLDEAGRCRAGRPARPAGQVREAGEAPEAGQARGADTGHAGLVDRALVGGHELPPVDVLEHALMISSATRCLSSDHLIPPAWRGHIAIW